MNRREFLRNSVYIPALGITLVYSLSDCSSDDSTTSSSSTEGTEAEGTCTTVDSVIGGNHGHTITDPTAEQVTALADITLNLTIGTPGETHTVSLTGANLSTISTCGTVVATTSRDNGHSHSVTFTGSV